MKILLCSVAFAALCSTLSAQAPEAAPATPAGTTKRPSTILDW